MQSGKTECHSHSCSDFSGNSAAHAHNNVTQVVKTHPSIHPGLSHTGVPVDNNEEDVAAEGEHGDVSQDNGDHNMGRRPVTITDPNQPTKTEIEEHNVTHTPYKPWCRHCVRGKGRSDRHFKHKSDTESQVPTISFDYCFLGQKGQDGTTPTIVGKDRKSKAFMSLTCCPMQRC